VIAHVRKGDRKSRQLVPGIEDFHGSSDISKIATKAIMLAPAHDKEDDEDRLPYMWPTYFHIGKCRTDGSRTRFLGLVAFNARRNAYELGYSMHKMLLSGDESELIPDNKRPHWAI
jgi:hypothetical protein